MITAVDIENLRGIDHGKLEGLAALTVLTGPNGCGKSTVLDALLIGGSPEPGHAVGHAVRRRPETRDGARWLVKDAVPQARATITTTGPGGAQKTVLMVASTDAFPVKPGEIVAEPLRAIQSVRVTGSVVTYFTANNAYRTSGTAQRAHGSVRLIDPGLTTPLIRVFSEASRQGRRAEAYSLLADLIPGFQSLDILTEDDGTPALYTTLAGAAIPVGLAGDGVQSFIQLALELSALTDGLALIEEPEVYQHPRAIHRTAQVLLAAMRRKIQIVLSTHSLELIDSLLDAATDADLKDMALFNLSLRGGTLSSSRYSGQDIVFNRDGIANDLR